MQSSKLEMKDFKEFEAFFLASKLQIQDKFCEGAAGGISEDVAIGFQKYIDFLEDKLTKAGKKPVMKAVSQQSLEVANIESLGTRLLNLFDKQFVGDEEDRTGKLYEFLDQMRDDVISANKLNSAEFESQKQDAIIAAINTHSQIVKQGNAEIAALTKKLKETEDNLNDALKELEKYISVIKDLEGKIVVIEEEKLFLSQKLSKDGPDLGLA